MLGLVKKSQARNKTLVILVTCAAMNQKVVCSYSTVATSLYVTHFLQQFPSVVRRLGKSIHSSKKRDYDAAALLWEKPDYWIGDADAAHCRRWFSALSVVLFGCMQKTWLLTAHFWRLQNTIMVSLSVVVLFRSASSTGHPEKQLCKRPRHIVS